MNNRIWLSSPHMSGDEQKYIQEAFDGNWVAPLGPNVDNFEKDLASYIGVKDAAALSSGTAAIHLALIMLGIEQKDEVLVSSFTFCASVNPIVYVGAKPIFIDSERDTWNIDPDLLEQAIKDRIKKTGKTPKALILVHLYGMPAKLDEIISITKKYGIPIIEDAAEALGSKYKGKLLGSFGDIGILSFNGNKIITTSGGGALVSNNEEYTSKARFLATQARDQAPHYQHSEMGFNFRMSNILAGIGRGQISVIEDRVSKRREMNAFYSDIFMSVSEIDILKEPTDIFHSNFWLTTILLNEKKYKIEHFIAEFNKDNIETRPLWKPMHLQPLYSNSIKYISGVSEELFNKGLCLPSGSNLTEDEKDRIKKVILSILS